MKRMVSCLLVVMCLFLGLAGCAKEEKFSDADEFNKKEFINQVQQNMVSLKPTGKLDEIPEKQETTTTEFHSKFDDYPAEYFIKWLVCDARVSRETEDSINQKLEEDGYSFGVKFMHVDGDCRNYTKQIKNSGADIAFIGYGMPGSRFTDEAVEERIFFDLDEWLSGSKLYDSIPQLCWEKVRCQGRICLVPSEAMQEIQIGLWILEEKKPNGFVDKFDGNILSLENILSEELPLFLRVDGFDVFTSIGYVYDHGKGLVFDAEGRCINPLEDEKCVELLRTINRWYHEKKLDRFNGHNAKNSENGFYWVRYGVDLPRQEKMNTCYMWKGFVCHTINCSAGILASSDKKEDAFAFLELVHTDHSYGDLLAFGKEKLEKENVSETVSSNTSACELGVDTGLRWRVEGLSYFRTIEEKKEYYDQYIVASPSLYFELFPSECDEIITIIRKFTDMENSQNIFICSDFEAILAKFQTEMKEPMDKIIEQFEKEYYR